MSLRLLARLNIVTYSCSVHQPVSTSLPLTLPLQLTPAVFPGLCASLWLHSPLEQPCSFYKKSYKGSIPTLACTLAVLVPDFPPGFSFSMPQLFSGLWANVLCPGKLVSSKPRKSMPLSCSSTGLGCCKWWTHICRDVSP